MLLLQEVRSHTVYVMGFNNSNTHIFRQVGSRRRMSKTGSHISATQNRQSLSVNHGGAPVALRDEAAAMTLNSRLGPVAETSMLSREAYCAEHTDPAFKYPHLQVHSVIFNRTVH